jgi:type I restriction enzyme S subunit
MGNVIPLNSGRTPDFQADVQHFSIGSKWLYEEDCRFDAKNYAQEVYGALDILNRCPYSKVILGNIVGQVYHPTENQARSNFKRIWVKPGEGPPFLTGKQLFFLRPEREKFISSTMPKLHELKVPEGTILLSRSGTTGFPVLVGKWLSQFAITDDALRLYPGSAPIGFVYAYLASSIGRPLTTKSEYGSTVSHLEAKHITEIPIPILPDSVQQSIHEKIIRAYALRDEANELFDKADTALYELLGVSPFVEDDIEYLSKENDPRTFSLSSLELGERLDATHHVPTSRSVVHKLQRGHFHLVRLGEKVEQVYVAPRFARIYVKKEFGTPLLQGSQLPSMRLYNLKYISNAKTDKIERWLIRRDWVLVTCSGTIGRVAVSSTTQDGWAASQHILRIIPKTNTTHPGFLAAFLTTPFGQHQLKAKIYGGVVDELTAEDTEEIFIPDVPYSKQTQIGEAIVKVYEMRDEANALEDEAVAELENLISDSSNK